LQAAYRRADEVERLRDLPATQVRIPPQLEVAKPFVPEPALTDIAPALNIDPLPPPATGALPAVKSQTPDEETALAVAAQPVDQVSPSESTIAISPVVPLPEVRPQVVAALTKAAKATRREGVN
jgi:hypothetical protein